MSAERRARMHACSGEKPSATPICGVEANLWAFGWMGAPVSGEARCRMERRRRRRNGMEVEE